jgi:hypothetical protein
LVLALLERGFTCCERIDPGGADVGRFGNGLEGLLDLRDRDVQLRRLQFPQAEMRAEAGAEVCGCFTQVHP